MMQEIDSEKGLGYSQSSHITNQPHNRQPHDSVELGGCFPSNSNFNFSVDDKRNKAHAELQYRGNILLVSMCVSFGAILVATVFCSSWSMHMTYPTFLAFVIVSSIIYLIPMVSYNIKLKRSANQISQYTKFRYSWQTGLVVQIAAELWFGPGSIVWSRRHLIPDLFEYGVITFLTIFAIHVIIIINEKRKTL